MIYLIIKLIGKILALRIAKDWRESSSSSSKHNNNIQEEIKKEDLSFNNDNIPAIHNIHNKSVDGGNMVNIIKQALEKRLNIINSSITTTTSGSCSNKQPLTGPETSATLMATDFLLEELTSIINENE